MKIKNKEVSIRNVFYSSAEEYYDHGACGYNQWGNDEDLWWKKKTKSFLTDLNE